MKNLRELAINAREYAEAVQKRQHNLEGACHENALGSGDCIRYNTDYDPILVWGSFQTDPDEEPPKSIRESDQRGLTHFWIELKNQPNSVIDIYALPEDWSSSNFSKGDVYCGSLPEEYNRLQMHEYYGKVESSDLLSASSFENVTSR